MPVVIGSGRKLQLTSLHAAAKGGFADIAELLTTYGADGNSRDSQGYSAAFYADQRGFTDVTAILPAPLKHATKNYSEYREQYLRVHDIVDRRKGRKKKAPAKKK